MELVILGGVCAAYLSSTLYLFPRLFYYMYALLSFTLGELLSCILWPHQGFLVKYYLQGPAIEQLKGGGSQALIVEHQLHKVYKGKQAALITLEVVYKGPEALVNILVYNLYLTVRFQVKYYIKLLLYLKKGIKYSLKL